MVKALTNQLCSIEVKIQHEDMYMVLLMSLPPSFDNLIISLESMSTKDVDLQFIVAQLLHEVSKRKENESTKNVTLFNKTHKANKRLCFYCKKSRHLVRIIWIEKLMRKKRQTKLVKTKNKCSLLPWVLMIIRRIIGSSILVQHNTWHSNDNGSPLMNPLFHEGCTWEMTPFWRPLAKGTSRPQCKLEVKCCLQPSFKFFMFPKWKIVSFSLVNSLWRAWKWSLTRMVLRG